MKRKSSTGKAEAEKPVCARCQHFFVTYDGSRPYGCRAYGFKSRRSPSLVVVTSSGRACQLFEAKRAGG